MTDRWKDIFIIITLGTVSILAGCWIIDILLIDGLKVDKGLLGSVLGGLIGAFGVIITTYFIIEAQKKTHIEQIKAQKEITLKQVNDADLKSRLLLLSQIKINSYERTLTTLTNLEYEIKVFQKKATNVTVLKISFYLNNSEGVQVNDFRNALIDKTDSYHIVNNTLLSLITNFRIDNKAETLLKVSVLHSLINQVAEEAELLDKISNKFESTIDEVNNKAIELHSIFVNMSTDLRNYLSERIEEVEQELVKDLKE